MEMMMKTGLVDEYFDRETRDAAHQQAKILLAAATDPEGCRARLTQLEAATVKHDEARDAAEARKQAARDLEGTAIDGLARLQQEREELAARVASTEGSFKKREAALAEVERQHAETTQRLALLEEALRKGQVRLDGAVRTMRQYLDVIPPTEDQAS
jgi:chromosome segregation ATPase